MNHDDRPDDSNACDSSELELAEIITKARRVLDDDEATYLCWGCGIDPRLTNKPRDFRA